MSGALLRLRLATPRISMFGPAPNRPVVGTMLTPATRELSSELRSGACDLASTSGALISGTSLPNSRRCWPPAVPVTITSERGGGRGEGEVDGQLAVRADGDRAAFGRVADAARDDGLGALGDAGDAIA